MSIFVPGFGPSSVRHRSRGLRRVIRTPQSSPYTLRGHARGTKYGVNGKTEESPSPPPKRLVSELLSETDVSPLLILCPSRPSQNVSAPPPIVDRTPLSVRITVGREGLVRGRGKDPYLPGRTGTVGGDPAWIERDEDVLLSAIDPGYAG